MDVKSKERGSNFSNNELELLKRLIEENKHILLCKKTDAVSLAQKEKTWVNVHTAFNASSSSYRTRKQLKYKFDNMKKSARKEASKKRRERLEITGGVQVPAMSSSDHPDKDWMRSSLVLSADSLESMYDDDALPGNTEPTCAEGTPPPLAHVNIEETHCVMTPSAEIKLEYIEHPQDVLLLSHHVIDKETSHAPSPSSCFEKPSGEIENVMSIKKSLLKDTGAPGCPLSPPVSSPLKCRKLNFGATPAAVRRSLKMLHEENLNLKKEKERILGGCRRRAEVEHSQKMRHAQELHDQSIRHIEERHQKEMQLLDLKIKMQEFQLKNMNYVI